MTPQQKPGRSKQDYGTPTDFLDAVIARFGHIDVDLAATLHNTVGTRFLSPELDSLSLNWNAHIEFGEIAWLNPPFANIDPWASKCVAHSHDLRAGARILLLVPASVGANWFRDHVHQKAFVYGLSPRLKFVGCKDAYPKDCILAEYGAGAGFDVWRWK